MLLIMKLKQSSLYTLNNMAFFASFLFFRMIVNTVLIYYVIKAVVLTFQGYPTFGDVPAF